MFGAAVIGPIFIGVWTWLQSVLGPGVAGVMVWVSLVVARAALLHAGDTVVVVLLVDDGRLHSVVDWSRLPVRTILLLCFTWRCLASKVAVHPLSHKAPIDSSGWRRAGNMCALRAPAGRVGRSRVAVWVACIVLPSGSLTWMPFWMVVLLVTGVLIGRKWPVHPESKMQLVVGVRSGGSRGVG